MVVVTLVCHRVLPATEPVFRETYCDKSPPQWSRFDHSMRLRAIIDSSFGGRYQCRKPDKKE
jgi:hypothetical protein